MYDVLEDDKVSRVIGNVNCKVFNYQVQFISKDDGNDVAVRAYNLVKFPDEKQKAMILFANECNTKYRYFKFVVNCNSNVLQLEYDCTLCCTDSGQEALEILTRIMKIVDAVGEDLMHQIWS